MKESIITFENFTIIFKELYQNVFSVKFERDKTLPFIWSKFTNIVLFLEKELPEHEYIYFEDDDVFKFAKFLAEKVFPINVAYEVCDTINNTLKNNLFGISVYDWITPNYPVKNK